MKYENHKKAIDICDAIEKIDYLIENLSQKPNVRIISDQGEIIQTIGTADGCEHDQTKEACIFIESLLMAYKAKRVQLINKLSRL